MPPRLCNPGNLDTLYRCLLNTVSYCGPRNTILILASYRDCCKPVWARNPNQPTLILSQPGSASRVSYQFLGDNRGYQPFSRSNDLVSTIILPGHFAPNYTQVNALQWLNPKPEENIWVTSVGSNWGPLTHKARCTCSEPCGHMLFLDVA